MIVTMRPAINPLCTIHHVLMNLAQFGERHRMTVIAYKCDEPGCTRAYNSSLGYFDLVNGQIARDLSQRICPDDEQPMFLEKAQGTGGMWRCAANGCDHHREHKPMKLDSVPGYPTNLIANGLPTNLVLNKTPGGQFQIARIVKSGGSKDAEFDILHTSNSAEDCTRFFEQQVERDFPGLLKQP